MLKSILILALLFAALASGFYMWNQSDRAMHTYVSTKGTFHEGRQCSGNESCASNPYVTFTTGKGNSAKLYPFQNGLAHGQILAAFYDEAAYRDGQSVPVLSDPDQPTQALISSPMHTWADALFWWALGACLLLGLFIRVVRQDQKKVVRR